jgi:hypothetical protein
MAGILPLDRLSPHYHADGDWLLLQSQDGRQWVTGIPSSGTRIEKRSPVASPFPPRKPAVLGAGRVALVSDAQHVVLVDLPAAKGVWSYEVPGDSTRTGEPPGMIVHERSLLVLIPRNFGSTVQRLHPDTGKALWPEESFLSAERIDPDQVALDRTAFYYAAENVIYAHSLNDGKRLWELPLQGPAGPWQVVRAANSLLAYPAVSPTDRFGFRWLGTSLELQLTRPPHDPTRRGFPLLVCDPETGKLIQRLNLTAGPVWTSRRSDSTEQSWLPKVEWRRGVEGGSTPVVALTPKGVVVALEQKAWGLRPMGVDGTP